MRRPRERLAPAPAPAPAPCALRLRLALPRHERRTRRVGARMYCGASNVLSSSCGSSSSLLEPSIVLVLSLVLALSLARAQKLSANPPWLRAAHGCRPGGLVESLAGVVGA